MSPGRRDEVTIDQADASRIELMAIKKPPGLNEQIGFIDLRKIPPMVQDNLLFPLVPDTLQQFPKNHTQGNHLPMLNVRNKQVRR